MSTPERKREIRAIRKIIRILGQDCTERGSLQGCDCPMVLYRNSIGGGCAHRACEGDQSGDCGPIVGLDPPWDWRAELTKAERIDGGRNA